MTWLDKLERRFGHLAIPHLLRYVVLLNALVFVLLKLNPNYGNYLTLDPQAILDGQVWRLISHIFIPPSGGFFTSWIVVVLYLMFLNMLGEGLEEAIGSFQLNLYYLLGVLGVTVAAFLTGRGDGGFLLNNSLLFAFAWYYPDLHLYILGLLPVKVKWVALFDAALVAWYFITGGWSHKFAIIASLMNFALFFGPRWFAARRDRQEVQTRRAQFEEAMGSDESLHQCVVCGRTELVAPEVEFRVARDGQEYCLEHLPKAR